MLETKFKESAFISFLDLNGFDGVDVRAMRPVLRFSHFHLPFTEVCAPGSTGAEEGPGCVECAADTYKAGEGRQACDACPLEPMTNTLGATGSDGSDDCLGK